MGTLLTNVTNYRKAFSVDEIDATKAVKSYSQTGRIGFFGDPASCDGPADAKARIVNDTHMNEGACQRAGRTSWPYHGRKDTAIRRNNFGCSEDI